MPTSSNLLNNIMFSLIKPFNNQKIYKKNLFILISSDYYCLWANCPLHSDYVANRLRVNRTGGKSSRTGSEMSRGKLSKWRNVHKS